MCGCEVKSVSKPEAIDGKPNGCGDVGGQAVVIKSVLPPLIALAQRIQGAGIDYCGCEQRDHGLGCGPVCLLSRV